MFPLIVCDLDGTLLNPEHRLGAYTRCVLERLRAQGIEVMLASGRHFQDIRTLADQLGRHGCLISSNGAAVHDRELRLVDCHPLDPADALALINAGVPADVHTNVYRTDDWLVDRPEPYLLQFHQASGFGYRVVDLRNIDGSGVLKVFFYGAPEQLQPLEQSIRARFGDRVHTTFSLPVTLEIMARGVSKGAALKRVAQRLGIGLDAVLAFGDGMNDLELLQCAGTGIIMGNADPRLRAALPALQVIGSNAQESVARHLEGLLLSA
ncbi:Cof-type HAD-IIB family hydrolase [uncultured Thiodictyon sp.]|uniref:Cof-type HAD-IIB family hydrolase n=1 Tax=uncultured Thiodictyon sp. TaxID=1846217 RepID=UPI0025EE1D4A|nr:Cof-type HAD-IIB family hydrolase [uncultured Thiodictyon sp.]